MSLLIADPQLADRLMADRRASDGDRFDEVWEGTYVMAPLPNDEHQEIQGDLYSAIRAALRPTRDARVRPGVNVSDRDAGWTENYRCPDIAVFLGGSTAKNRGTHWVGGPDFAVEILSPGDLAREKLAFYAAVGVREVLIVDRYPWALELYRRAGDTLALVGRSEQGSGLSLKSDVLPVSFALHPGANRPVLELSHRSSNERWLV